MKKFFLNNFFFIFWNYFNLINIILVNILVEKILMFAFLNYISLSKIIINNFCYYYSRSRNIFWFKGLKSKNLQILKIIYIDCDMDFIIFKIFQYYNISCHTSYNFCNHNKLKLFL